MRVISGIAKNRKLKAPSRARPLTDRAKEALFNILCNRIADSVFLDLFAGSGAVGIEALSRGAKQAFFVELDRNAVLIINENLATTGLSQGAVVINRDAERSIGLFEKQGTLFDIIFVGAPYDSLALDPVLEKIGASKMIGARSLVIAEHRKQHSIKDDYGNLHAFRSQRYGETELTFYEYSGLSGQL